MLNITGADIAFLNDADSRTLVARLANAELSAVSAPIRMHGLSRSKFYKSIDEGIIVRKKSGRASLILVSSLHDYIARLPTE